MKPVDVLRHHVSGAIERGEKEAVTQIRPLSAIAAEIKREWPKPYFGAVPYLDAMMSLHSIEDKYYLDDARSIVQYFLANAQTWKGEKARSIKAELKAMVRA